jgi:hypothetical protein
MKAILASFAAALVVGCSSPGGVAASAETPPGAPAQDDGVLLNMDFDVDLIYGDFVAETEDGLWTLTVTEQRSAKLVFTPAETGSAEEMFTASTEPTFDGLRFVITRVKGERTEAEAYFKALENGYEFKDKRLLDNLDFPKSFTASGQ